jgi:hypothetical protein
VSLRLRHEYAVDLPMASTSSRVRPPAKFPATQVDGCAPHPAEATRVLWRLVYPAGPALSRVT